MKEADQGIISKLENATLSITTIVPVIVSVSIGVLWVSDRFATRDSIKEAGAQYFATKQELKELQITLTNEFESLKRDSKAMNENILKENKEQNQVLDSVRDNTTRIMTIIELMQRDQVRKSTK